MFFGTPCSIYRERGAYVNTCPQFIQRGSSGEGGGGGIRRYPPTPECSRIYSGPETDPPESGLGSPPTLVSAPSVGASFSTRTEPS